MANPLLRFSDSLKHDPAIDAWLNRRPAELGTIARKWFLKIRRCGTDVRELMHDGCPTACIEDAGFAYVNVFKAHVNLGFFQGASLKDPARILVGDGKYMRHLKLRPGIPIDEPALEALVAAAYADIKERLGRKSAVLGSSSQATSTRKSMRDAKEGKTTKGFRNADELFADLDA